MLWMLIASILWDKNRLGGKSPKSTGPMFSWGRKVWMDSNIPWSISQNHFSPWYYSTSRRKFKTALFGVKYIVFYLGMIIFLWKIIHLEVLGLKWLLGPCSFLPLLASIQYTAESCLWYFLFKASVQVSLVNLFPTGRIKPFYRMVYAAFILISIHMMDYRFFSSYVTSV